MYTTKPQAGQLGIHSLSQPIVGDIGDDCACGDDGSGIDGGSNDGGTGDSGGKVLDSDNSTSVGPTVVVACEDTCNSG